MAQSHEETTKDIVVALLSSVEKLSIYELLDKPDDIGKSVAKIYEIVYAQVKK